LKDGKTQVDSPEVKKEPMIMPSTKSAPVFPAERKAVVDPPRVRKTEPVKPKKKKKKNGSNNTNVNTNSNQNNQPNQTIIHSTKSGKVI
jgi:hypothetical protein